MNTLGVQQQGKQQNNNYNNNKNSWKMQLVTTGFWK